MTARKWADAAGEVVGRLRPIAEAATPGGWFNGPAATILAENGMRVCSVAVRIDATDANDALHIATFDPPTVLALLDKVEAALTGWPAAEAERDALAARVAELEAYIRKMIPANMSLDNPRWPDDTNVPLDVPLGDLREARDLLARAALNKDEANAK